MNNSPLARERARVVRETIAQVRVLLRDETPGVAEIQCALAPLRSLAARAELWESDDFPIPEGSIWHAYSVSEDSDGGYAMYAVPMHPGHAQPPHDHTTWALIAGVRGNEVNRLYRRPRGDRPAPLEHLGDVTVTLGNALALGPADIHAIEVIGPHDALHLHLYGKGLSHLSQRHMFDLATGTARPFPVLSPSV